MPRTDDHNTDAARFDAGAGALWASAFVIGAMIISQASRLGSGQTARADVSSVGDLTVLTTSAGDNDDILAVLDRRAETLYIYGFENGRDLNLYQTHRVDQLFTEAQGATRRSR